MNSLLLLSALLAPGQPGQGYRWEPFADGDTRQVKLMCPRGYQVGVYVFKEDAYYPIDRGTLTFGAACAAPIEPPARTNYGVARERLAAVERYRIGEREVSRSEAWRAASGQLPDHASKERVVLIGAGRDQVARDLAGAAELAPWRDRLIVQGYDPGHWHVKDVGYDLGGTPSVYVLAPDGTVLHHQADYAGGAVALAEALRRVAPDRKPDKDPDRRKPELPFALPLNVKLPWSVYALGVAAILALLYMGRGQSKP